MLVRTMWIKYSINSEVNLLVICTFCICRYVHSVIFSELIRTFSQYLALFKIFSINSWFPNLIHPPSSSVGVLQAKVTIQLDATYDFYCRSYCLLSMFWAPLCPSCGLLQPANRTHNPQLHTTPTAWKPKHQIPQAATTCTILSSSWWWA